MEFSNLICLNIHTTGCNSSVDSETVYNYLLQPDPRSTSTSGTFFRELGFGHENISTAILRFPLIQEGSLSVNDRRMYTISTGSKEQCGWINANTFVQTSYVFYSFFRANWMTVYLSFKLNIMRPYNRH